MKYLLAITLILMLSSAAFALDVTKNVNGEYNVILPDGSGNQVAATFVVKWITSQGAYVGHLYDADGKCIAQNRRFFPVDAITDQLTTGEKGLVNNEEPKETWEVNEIKVWLDTKQTKDEKGVVLADDPYKYDEKDDKTALLKIISDKKEADLQEVAK